MWKSKTFYCCCRKFIPVPATSCTPSKSKARNKSIKACVVAKKNDDSLCDGDTFDQQQHKKAHIDASNEIHRVSNLKSRSACNYPRRFYSRQVVSLHLARHGKCQELSADSIATTLPICAEAPGNSDTCWPVLDKRAKFKLTTCAWRE